jgi:hypothetical protein
MAVDRKKAQEKSVRTTRWSMTMAKVRIAQAMARTRWQLVTFLGPAGAESLGNCRPHRDPQGSWLSCPRHEKG